MGVFDEALRAFSANVLRKKECVLVSLVLNAFQDGGTNLDDGHSRVGMTAGRMPPAVQRFHDQSNPEDFGIRDVWQDNLDEEMANLRKVVKTYKFVAMDTEFPGVVARPIGEFRCNSDYQYQLLRCNVDILRIIQVGLSFYNENGELAPGVSTFQFNFKFSMGEDMFAQDSIDLLQNSGIQFKKHETSGIHVQDFAALLITSGVVLMDDIAWLSFHSGFDFGYLLKMLTNTKLPDEEHEFFDLLKLYFPRIYDVKYLMKSCKSLKGGLQV